VPAAVLRDSVGNLRTELTSFVGRRGELAEAKVLLESARLLTLTGMGGVGKTRLARRLGAEVQRAFADGVWEVDLAELQEPALVAATIAAALGLHESQAGWSLVTLQGALDGRRLLLVLDNCEHLLDACAVTVDALLRGCLSLHVLATSRQPLGIDGEQTLPVAPLAVPNPHHRRDLDRLEEFDAARLFVERASAASPGFVVDGQNAAAVAELCRRLDGLPLALEFAALRVRALSPAEILSRLDVLSASGSRIAPSRQQSLRSLIDWSYQLCSEAERRLWCLLSVVVGRFDVETVEHISGEHDPVPLLVELVDKSVLVREVRDGPVRYRMPVILREYGLERLAEAGLTEQARDRHLDFIVGLAHQGYLAYAGPDQQAWFDRIRHLSGDLRAAFEHALSKPGSAPLAVALGIDLLDYEVAFGSLSESRHWLKRTLRAELDDLSRARALRGIAYLAAFQGETTSLREATLLARDHPAELDWCAVTEAVIALVAGDRVTASARAEQAVTGMRERGDLHGLINALTLQVLLAGDLEATQAAADTYLALADPLGERWVRAYVLWALGLAAWRAGDLERAAELELEAMATRIAFGDRLGLIWSAEVLGWIAADQGAALKAATLLGAASQAADAIGSSVDYFSFLAENHAPCVERLRAALGDDAYATAVGSGRALLPAQVLELASGRQQPPPLAAKKPTARGPLTRRELEIAELVAQGLSNRDIAAKLVIAPRTAEGHVEHILVKLGFSSRSQIAAWVAERRAT
jgi:predicted ATPase/DNA-binding CsgD family transcriptional regulator